MSHKNVDTGENAYVKSPAFFYNSIADMQQRNTLKIWEAVCPAFQWLLKDSLELAFWKHIWGFVPACVILWSTAICCPVQFRYKYSHFICVSVLSCCLFVSLAFKKNNIIIISKPSSTVCIVKGKMCFIVTE